VIQQVEVAPRPKPADNGDPAGQLDTSLSRKEIRADQIAFFTRGVRSTTQIVGSQESSYIEPNGVQIVTGWAPESAVCRMYYGHGFTAPTVPVGLDAFSYLDKDAPVVPWIGGQVETQRWTDGAAQAAARVTASKPSNWPLVRMATLVSSDGTTTRDYAGRANFSSLSLFTDRRIALGKLAANNPTAATYYPLWTSGRVDHVKWQTDDIFSQTAYQVNQQGFPVVLPFIFDDGSGPNFSNPWTQSSSRLRMIQTLANWAAPTTSGSGGNGATQLYLAYPRVEKVPPSASRSDVMLTAPVLAANCSSFKIEWTWKDGVGSTFGGSAPGTPPQGGESIGMFIRTGTPVPAQPWFGLDPLGSGSVGASTVRPVSNSPNFLDNGTVGDWGAVGLPLVVGNSQSDLVCPVEGPMNRSGDALVNNSPVWRCGADQDSKRVYQAVFGLNQQDASIVNPFSTSRGPYTPMPSAIRITVRLHDSLGRIEGGREFQFIVDLPKR